MDYRIGGTTVSTLDGSDNLYIASSGNQAFDQRVELFLKGQLDENFLDAQIHLRPGLDENMGRTITVIMPAQALPDTQSMADVLSGLSKTNSEISSIPVPRSEMEARRTNEMLSERSYNQAAEEDARYNYSPRELLGPEFRR